MMKKITLIMLALVSLSLSAQTYYSEDFEAETEGAAPSAFTVLNEDACTIENPGLLPNESWTVLDDAAPQGLTAQAMSWTNNGCAVDDWMITSAIDLSAATPATSLSWKGKSTNESFLETYEVLLSTTGTATTDFTTLLETVVDELDAWTSHSVSLAPHVGTSVYIAFRLISADEDRCAIDDILVSEPAALDMVVSEVNTNGVKQTSAFSTNQFLIVDFSERTNFTADVVVDNVGTSAVDSLYLTYFLVDAVNAPTLGVAFGDTVFVPGSIASGASYTHTFEAFGIDTLFPNLASDATIDFYVQVDSSSWNTISGAEDANYNIVIAPAESYTMPYSSSFEVADLGAGLFLFDHSTWGWKYLDNDGDGESLSVGNDFSNLPAYDGSMQVYGSLNGSTIGIGAENETAQTPELSLTGGTAYGFSVYARTAFNQTGSIEMQISTDNGSYVNTIGTASLSGADSTYTKYSFSLVAPSTQDDYVVNLNKTATGFIILDLFEIVELQQPTATITVNSSSTDEPGVEYCDSTVTVNFSSAGNPETLSLDWGDGTVEDVTGLTSATHTYASFGSYTIQISATNVVGTGTADAALSFTALPAPTVTFGAPAITDLTVAVTIGSSVGSNVVFTPACSRVIVDWGDGTIDEVTGSSSTSHTYGGEGTYTITVTVIGSGQESASQDVTLTGPSSINEISFEDAVSIYPNPSNEIVNVSFSLVSAENIELAIYAVDGKVVDVRSFSNVKEVNTSFNTATLNNGVYVMKITSDNGVTAQKFVVSHN